MQEAKMKMTVGDSGSVRAAKTGRKTNRSKTVIGGALTGKGVGMWLLSK